MAEHPHQHTPEVHVTPLLTYLLVFAALAAGTLLTWWVSTIDLGWMNTPIALLIATIKATLVILFFMHVIHSTRLTWVVIIGAFLWLGVLFVLTFADYLTRAGDFWSIY
jgi:cytochrome c oxidase subunit 4